MTAPSIVSRTTLVSVMVAYLLIVPLTVNAEQVDEEVVVVATTPAGGVGQNVEKLPFNVQVSSATDLARSQVLDLTDFLATNLGSVNINSAQSNPLQPDVQYRGYAASPLLGLSQGIAVYQNGSRINEPFGDAVNWDLIPQSAIHRISLIGGSNPLFGLNTLGGALSIEMKNGFNFEGLEAQISGGAWERVVVHGQAGGNDGRFGYYINASYFEEGGWRDLSDSDVVNVLASASYRGDNGRLDFTTQHGDSDLRGNGSSPLGLLELDRAAVFTAPDITDNTMTMVNVTGAYEFSDSVSANVSGFYRRNKTASFNGDGSDLLVCELGSGAFLLDEFDESAFDSIGFDDDDVCSDNVLGANDPADLERILTAGFGPTGASIDVDDLTGTLSGTGVLADSAINNTSQRKQRSYGGDLQFNFSRTLFGHVNAFTLGFGYYRGAVRFESATELATLDPRTRSTEGRGVGTFLSGDATNVSTSSDTLSVYFNDALDLTERLTLTLGGRFNSTEVELADRSSMRPELNGEHTFRRFNPAVGATYDVSSDLNIYAGYSESSRAPTPIELACNEGVFSIARRNAAAAGRDPDDIDFECRLPNAFLADPPLDDIIASTVEFGLRGQLGEVRHRLGYFHTDNRNDILFQTTGRGRGLFANVDKTRRQGLETAFSGTLGALDWDLSYTFLRATFEDGFTVLSPNHPQADDDGALFVEQGNSIPGVPDHQFKFIGDYPLPFNARMGIEVIYNSGQYLRGDEANLLSKTDDYAIVNWRVSVPLNPRVELFARVSNVFDAEYENFGLLGEDPSEVLPGITHNSTVFLGSGAPRGGWVGLRMTL